MPGLNSQSRSRASKSRLIVILPRRLGPCRGTPGGELPHYTPPAPTGLLVLQWLALRRDWSRRDQRHAVRVQVFFGDRLHVRRRDGGHRLAERVQVVETEVEPLDLQKLLRDGGARREMERLAAQQ